MLFLLFITIPFIIPVLGYTWIWSRYRNSPSNLAHTDNAILGLGILLGVWVLMRVNDLFPSNMVWSICLILGFLGPIFLALYLHFAKQAPTEKRKNALYKRHLQFLMLGIFLFVNLTPIVAYSVKATYCFYQSQDEAEILSQALAAYERDNQHYPKSFDALVPNYLDAIPERECSIIESNCQEMWDDIVEFRILDVSDTIEAYALTWFFANTAQACLS